MANRERRRTSELRKGRFSVAGAMYFVTACVVHRRPLFADPQAARVVRQVLLRLIDDQDATWLAGTVMPNHFHLVFELGNRLSLDRTLAKIKGLVSRRLNGSDQSSLTITRHGGDLWQENAFEHCLRPREDPESYAFYTFMNPYRAGLVGLDEPWPWWVCSDSQRFRFLDALRLGGLPQPEWLEKIDEVSSKLTTGEP